MRFAPLATLTLIGLAAPAQAEFTAEQALAASRARFAATDDECQSSGREIVVCAQINTNDRYRLPFVAIAPGDPRHESVTAERARLQANPGTCQGWSFFRAQCGSVGVSLSVGAGGARFGGTRRAY
ncbi:MAG: hypothetical protein H7X93_13760 [Sphingomonadaceae bacterium]|nr:hypothetical protein [Sphingomonadaceae bacterium]